MSLYRRLVGHKSRINYWSCTDFAGSVRKISGVTKKPKVTTPEGWKNWRSNNVGTVGYWITEEGLDYLQDFFLFPADVWRNINVYVRNRFVDKLHYLDTKLERGEWHDSDSRILHGLFETLVTFVESEKAYMQQVADRFEQKQNKKRQPWAIGPRKTKFHRSREDGLKHLDWEIGLEDCPGQAEHAKEIKALYLWWKDIRPNRVDPMDACGWSKYCAAREKKTSSIFSSMDRSDEDRELVSKLLDVCNQLEDQQHQEDEDMMIRLVRIRRGLWT